MRITWTDFLCSGACLSPHIWPHLCTYEAFAFGFFLFAWMFLCSKFVKIPQPLVSFTNVMIPALLRCDHKQLLFNPFHPMRHPLWGSTEYASFAFCKTFEIKGMDCMDCIYIALFNYSKCLTTQASIHPFIHILTQGR